MSFVDLYMHSKPAPHEANVVLHESFPLHIGLSFIIKCVATTLMCGEKGH